jgi:uncharacterized protein (DUF305 family)
MIRSSVLPSSVLRRGLLAGAAVTAALVLSACGSSDSPSIGHGAMTTAPSNAAAGAATFNDADVAFAQHIIGHHQQAIQMAALADSRADGADVKELAAKIKAAQQPERGHPWQGAGIRTPAPAPCLASARDGGLPRSAPSSNLRRSPRPMFAPAGQGEGMAKPGAWQAGRSKPARPPAEGARR